MQFPRVESALAACSAHLDATKARNTEIDSYLVGYLLVLAYSEFEQRLDSIIAVRCARVADPHVQKFLSSARRRVVGRIKISDLAGMLAGFDDACKLSFQAAVLNTEAHAAYDNVITNRTLVAHVQGTGTTFTELEGFFPKCGSVFDAICIAIGLTPDEINAVSAGLVISRPQVPDGRFRRVLKGIGEWLVRKSITPI